MRKMKKMVVFLFCFACLAASAQVEIKSNEFPNYQGVVSVENSAQEIFTKTKMWFSGAFKSSNDVIQYADENEGVIIGKGNTLVGKGLWVFRFFFTIKIECRDNRFRYTVTVTDVHPSGGTNSLYNEVKNSPKLYKKNLEEFEKTVQDLVTGIINTPLNNSDEW